MDKAVDYMERAHALGLEIAERSAELNDRLGLGLQPQESLNTDEERFTGRKL